MNPKTKRQIKYRYCAGKLAGWLELHGEAAGYDASVGPTVEVMKAFSSHCFINRTFYSTLVIILGFETPIGCERFLTTRPDRRRQGL